MAKHNAVHHETKIPDSNSMLVAIVAIVAVVGLVVLYSDGSITGEAKSGRATCVDSDGDDSLTFGAVQVGSRITPDMCRDATSLKEQICAGNRLQSPRRTCPAGYTCVSETRTFFGSVVMSARCQPVITTPTCLDSDGDGYQLPRGPPDPVCTLTTAADCDDGSAAVRPGATEICGNMRDEDCNGEDLACPPGIEAICDGRDDNANGVIDEGCDDDDDLYCDANMTYLYESRFCQQPNPNCCELANDCDDTNPSINVGGREVCGNNIDEDCDGADLVCQP